jgi:hypothetical protein
MSDRNDKEGHKTGSKLGALFLYPLPPHLQLRRYLGVRPFNRTTAPCTERLFPTAPPFSLIVTNCYKHLGRAGE